MHTLAFDLGASNGRAVIGEFDGLRLTIKEIHRFLNPPVNVGRRLHWDILRLYHEMKQGILKVKHLEYTNLKSMAIDAWGFDFGLLGSQGELLGNPYHYRDPQTDGMVEEVSKILSREEIFSRTGIQFIPQNTLYQLYAMKQASSPFLAQAETFLLIPALLRYFLTGEKKNELTSSSTTQLINLDTRKWDDHIPQKVDLSLPMFADIVPPGTVVGMLASSVCEELIVSAVPVIAVGEHDTASAVVAVPTTQENFAYLSCGTWSLLGTEVTEPVISQQALEWNFTNECGVNSTFRLLKNIMGLWLIQECLRIWEKKGNPVSYEEMTRLVNQATSFLAFIDPDHPMFVNPVNMPRQIQQYCRETNQYVPQTKGEILRCVMESLAMKYRLILERSEILTNQCFSGLHIVGGGTKNSLLMEFTANAIARPVWAGPTEASAIGNLLVQYMTLGQIKNVQEARSVVIDSFSIQTYEPSNVRSWGLAYEIFCNVTGC